MAIKDMLQTSEYQMLKERINFRLDNLIAQLILCQEVNEFKSLQGEIKSLVWAKDHLPQELLNQENPDSVPQETETAEEAMFGGGADDEYEA